MDIAEAMRIPSNEWQDVVTKDYLEDYIKSGGSAVRFISGPNQVVDRVAQELADRATSLGYHVVRLDPSVADLAGRRPDYHRIEKLFFGIASSLDWRSIAEQHLRRKMTELGYEMPPAWTPRGDLNEFLNLNHVDHNAFVSSFQRALRADIVQDRAMALEFRSAVSALTYHLIIPDSHLPTTEDVVLRWLCGEKAEPGDSRILKGYQIYGRINRSNARHMLVSLSHWVPKAGYSGTVAVFDFRPYEYQKPTRSQLLQQRALIEIDLERQRRRAVETAIQNALTLDQLRELVASMPSPEQRASEYLPQPEPTYTKSAYMHMVHLLRAFLDEIEIFERLLFVVLTTDQYYDTEMPRNYRDYDALHTRIANEVRGERGNPKGILCHLKEAL